MPRMVVTANQLNLRSSPSASKKSNRIATLNQGQEVDLTGAAVGPWVSVSAVIGGSPVSGFVNGMFLGPLSTTFPVPTSTGGALPEADLGSSSSARRTADGSRAHALGEPGHPGVPSAHGGGKTAGLRSIYDWLDPGKSAHLRWWPKSATTFCNIYVYDVCKLAGVYLPRVWWTASAIVDLKAGKAVPVKYGTTVSELAANYIFNWLVEFGADYGWQRVFSLDALQTAANNGNLGLICAQRTMMSKPGHIQMIAPEHGAFAAKRNSAGKVTNPLQSNAGAKNFTYGMLSANWYNGSNFREHGFWTAVTA